MNRTITYLISDKDAGFTIEQNLRHRGYSAKNITHLKKTPESVLLNGIWVHILHYYTFVELQNHYSMQHNYEFLNSED